MTMPDTVPAAGCPSYVLPLRWQQERDSGELTTYLRGLARVCEVIVADGSPGPASRAIIGPGRGSPVICARILTWSFVTGRSTA
jgi:hypothetical protein